jgi:hypothetical protein
MFSKPDAQAAARGMAEEGQTAMAKAVSIDLQNPEQLTQLSKTLRLGRDVLREAVKAFGPSAEKIWCRNGITSAA